MNTLTPNWVSAPAGQPAPSRSAVIVQHEDAVGEIAIPGWVIDLPSYRRWAHSDDYPESGWVSFLDGQIWVDLSMEEFITHNRVKTAYTYRIVDVLNHDPRGDFVSDRMLLTNHAANLSTEPDGLFFLWTTMQTGAAPDSRQNDGLHGARRHAGHDARDCQQNLAARKDKELLRELYWKAGVTEYWLVDARDDQVAFDILVHTPARYVAAPTHDGWVKSNVLGREFRLVKHMDPLGNPRFVVEAR